MPVSRMDAKPLRGIAARLRDIAKIADAFAMEAASSPSEGRDAEPLEQIERGFAEIVEALKEAKASGNLSAELRKVEARLDSIAKAVGRLATGR